MRLTRNYLFSIVVFLAFSTMTSSQERTTFSGDIQKYCEELTAFMGPNLNED